MFRALFSVAIVLLLSTIALLLYANYVHDDKPAIGNDLAAKTLPPETPKIESPPAQPTPPIQPPAPQPRAEPPRPKHPEPAPSQRIYVVEPGDSLWNISMKSFGSADYTGKIAELNHIAAKDRIHPGQVLLLPDAPKREAKPENLSRADEGAPATEGSEAKPPPSEPIDPKAEPDPITATNKGETPTDDSEVQPPMLNVNVKKP